MKIEIEDSTVMFVKAENIKIINDRDNIDYGNLSEIKEEMIDKFVRKN